MPESIDETGYIKVTLWGDKALQEYQKDSVICLKGFKVIEYFEFILYNKIILHK